MTAVDPRLGEIENRLNAATPGPWVEWHENGTPGQLEAYNCPPATGAFLVDYGAEWDQKQKDANFIAHCPSDVAYLLAELRKRDEALERVATLAKRWTDRGEHDMDYSKTIQDEDIAMAILTEGATKVENARHIRNALKGDGA